MKPENQQQLIDFLNTALPSAAENFMRNLAASTATLEQHNQKNLRKIEDLNLALTHYTRFTHRGQS